MDILREGWAIILVVLGAVGMIVPAVRADQMWARTLGWVLAILLTIASVFLLATTGRGLTELAICAVAPKSKVCETPPNSLPATSANGADDFTASCIALQRDVGLSCSSRDFYSVAMQGDETLLKRYLELGFDGAAMLPADRESGQRGGQVWRLLLSENIDSLELILADMKRRGTLEKIIDPLKKEEAYCEPSDSGRVLNVAHAATGCRSLYGTNPANQQRICLVKRYALDQTDFTKRLDQALKAIRTRLEQDYLSRTDVKACARDCEQVMGYSGYNGFVQDCDPATGQVTFEAPVVTSDYSWPIGENLVTSASITDFCRKRIIGYFKSDYPTLESYLEQAEAEEADIRTFRETLASCN